MWQGTNDVLKVSPSHAAVSNNIPWFRKTGVGRARCLVHIVLFSLCLYGLLAGSRCFMCLLVYFAIPFAGNEKVQGITNSKIWKCFRNVSGSPYSPFLYYLFLSL